MYRTSAVQFILLFSLAALAAFEPCVLAQPSAPDSSRDNDIVFRDLRLTVEGVTGTDSSGQAWQYNFDQAAFEKSASPRSDDQIRPGESGSRESADLPVEIRCTEELRLKPFERIVVVGSDEFVDGNISALGRVTVRGWVKGSIQSVNGPVIITESGQVNGDIRSPEINVRRGGIHLGTQNITDELQFPEGLKDSFETAGLWVVFGLSLFFLLSAFLYVTLMPRQLDNFSHCVTRYPVKSAAVGLLFVFGLPVLILLLVITLVGALVIPFVPFAYLFAITLGVVTFSRLIGSRFLRVTVGGVRPPLLEAAVGLALVMAMWTTVALLMGSSSQVAFGFGVAALVISIIISCFPICSGIGAAVLTRFGFRSHTSLRDRLTAEQAAVPAPAPPPIRRTTPFDVPGQSSPPVPPPPDSPR
jgi:hypothetical protein